MGTFDHLVCSQLEHKMINKVNSDTKCEVFLQHGKKDGPQVFLRQTVMHLTLIK